MAILLGNEATTRITADGNTGTLNNFEVFSGNDRLLVVRAGTIRTSESDYTLSCTYGGVAMTEAVTVTASVGGSSRRYRQSIFYLIAPAVGTANVVITASSTIHGYLIDAVALYNVHQTTPIGAVDTDTGSSTDTNTLVLTSCLAGSRVLAGVVSNTNNTPTWAWSGATESYDVNGTASSSELAGSGADVATTAAGDVTITAVRSASVATMVAAAVEVRGVGGAVVSASAADGLKLAETTARRAIYRKTAADGLRGGDTPTRRAVYRRTATDGLRGTETPGRRAIYRRAAADGLRGAEGVTPRRALRATATESLGLAGAMGKRAALRVGPGDLLRLLEAAVAGGRIPAAAADGLRLSPAGGRVIRVARVAADTWRLTPTAARRATWRPGLVDALRLVDAAELPFAGETGTLHLLPAADGIENVADGTVQLATTSWNVNATQLYALKFDNLDIPPGAVIDLATLGLYVLTYDDPGLTSWLEDSAAPANLAATAYNLSGRARAAVGVAWTAANIGTNRYVTSPDLAAVIQQAVDLAGWTRGQSDIVLILRDNGTGGWIRGQTADSSTKPTLDIEWHSGGLTLTVVAADTLAMMDDATRRAIVAAATADSVTLATATTTTLALLLAESWRLSETVLTLARLTVGDALLLGDGVYLTYLLSLTEPVALVEALTRIAQARAAAVDALTFVTAARTIMATAAGDAMTLADGLAGRRLLAALAADVALWHLAITGDIAGVLEALAGDGLGLDESLTAGWHARTAVADALGVAEALAALRRFAVVVADHALAGDVVATLRRVGATGADTAQLTEALRALMRTRAGDALAVEDIGIAALTLILMAAAGDEMGLGDAARASWRVTARDEVEFVAAVAAIMHWLEAVGDALGLSGAAVYLLPNGIVRIEFAIMAATMTFEVVGPRADLALRAPVVAIDAHGLTER